jgi:hypothetical protein
MSFLLFNIITIVYYYKVLNIYKFLLLYGHLRKFFKRCNSISIPDGVNTLLYFSRERVHIDAQRDDAPSSRSRTVRMHMQRNAL